MFKRITLFLLFSIYMAYGETLEEVINIALRESPYIKKYQYQIKAVEGELIDRSGYYNPEVSVEFGRLYSQTDSGVTLTSFSVMERLRLWGEMDYAINSVKYKREAIGYLMEQEANKLSGEIYKAFYNSLYLKKQIMIKIKELKLVRDIYRYVSKSYKAGEIILLDVLRAKRDLEIVKIQLKNLEAKYRGSLNNLSALVGRKIKDVTGDLYYYPQLEDVDLEKLPINRYYDLMEKSLSEEVKRQKVLGKPQFAVGFVAGEDAVETGKYEFGVAVSTTLPIFNRNKGKVIQVLSEKNILLQEKRAQILNLKYSLKAVKSQYDLLKSQIYRIDREVIPELKEALTLARKGYHYGTLTFFEFSSVRKQYFDTLMYKAELSYQLHQLYGDYIKVGGFKR